MNYSMLFLPQPRFIITKSGDFNLNSNQIIQICAEEPINFLFAAKQIAAAVADRQHFWHISASRGIPKERCALIIYCDPKTIAHPQGYHLEITPNGVQLIGSDEVGIFYGIQTLKQLISQVKTNTLPCLIIDDWPDFPVRGVMLDISRDKVYRLETLTMLIDKFAAWKINQIQLYTEHTFAYLDHEVVWQNASPLTSEDILELDAYCQERFIELVPNQNSFGHMTRWLKHPEYRHLAEMTGPVQTPWGSLQTEPFSLAPTRADTINFITSLYDQLLPNFSSRIVNVGCDETFDICQGVSKPICKEKGKGRVYHDYILKLHEILKSRGYTMQFWGDIILEYPELVSELPKDLITLDWGYEEDHLFEKETKIFKEAGVPYYVCPGTSAWNSVGGRLSNMITNLQSAAKAGLQNCASGYLNTDWGDNGHWQQLPISYPGFVLGAAYSWCFEANEKLPLGEILNQIVFQDKSKTIGSILSSIGEEYKAWGLTLPNSSPIFWLLQKTREDLNNYSIKDIQPVQESLDRLKANLSALDRLQLNSADANLIKKELNVTIRLMIHACKRAFYLYSIRDQPSPLKLLREIEALIADYKTCWFARARPGGMSDSVARFTPLLNEYKDPLE